MEEIIKSVFAAPVASLLVVAGLVFLGIAVAGNISGKIAPGKAGRLFGAILGIVLLGSGILMHSRQPASQPSSTSPANAQSQTPAPESRSTPGAAPGSTQTPAPQGFRIVEVILRADPLDHVGPCPVTIKFSGRISVVGGSGRVSYKFLRSDGASAPIQTLTFDAPGSQDVSTTWTLGGAGSTYSGWEAIQILEPQELRSSQADFKMRCQ